MQEVYPKQSIINLAVSMLSRALRDGYDINSNIYLSNAQYIMEEYTGLTLNMLKKYIEASCSKPLSKEEIEKDSQNLSIKEMATKWGRTEHSIRSYCNRHHIHYKKKPGISKEQVAREIMALNGNYSYVEIGTLTHHHPSLIKEVCKEFDLEGKLRGNVCKKLN